MLQFIVSSRLSCRKPSRPILLVENQKRSKWQTLLSIYHQYIVNNSLLTLWRYWHFLQVRMVFFVLLCCRLKADERTRRDKKDVDRGRQRDGRGRGRGRPEVIQSHSIFEQGPAEMMAKRKGKGGHQGRIWEIVWPSAEIRARVCYKWH